MGSEAKTNGAVNGHSGLYIPPRDAFIPMIIDGEDIIRESKERHYKLPHSHDPTIPSESVFQGTDEELTLKAIAGAEKAFKTWSTTGPSQRRYLLFKLAQIVRDNEKPLRDLIKDEIHADDFFTFINYAVTIGTIEEPASNISSEALNGQIPSSVVPGCYPLVFNEPYGVILGMAPWNAPLILGFRAIIAPIAAGNTVIFKGSEFSPRVHYVIANMFRMVGFPPGVCQFILHRPEDAVETFNTCISHPAIKKANFTGSTAVGRSIAMTAAKYLKPILLELGGKNISIVLDDANIELAAKQTLDAAVMNNGQICMCTDTVLVQRSVASALSTALHKLLETMPNKQHHVIASKGRANLTRIFDDAKSKGAKITQASGSEEGNLYPVTLIENLEQDSMYHHTESFGPMLAIRSVDSEDEIVSLVHESGYGLSSSIFSKNHLRAINLARRMDVGAVHINAGSVHDEGNLPHGGVGNSGYGRFGGAWGLREFTRTKTVMVYPDTPSH